LTNRLETEASTCLTCCRCNLALWRRRSKAFCCHRAFNHAPHCYSQTDPANRSTGHESDGEIELP